MPTAAVIIGVQSVLLSVAIAGIVYQWFRRRPSAISERLDELDRQIDFLAKLNVQMECRQDIAKNCGCIEGSAIQPTATQSGTSAIQSETSPAA